MTTRIPAEMMTKVDAEAAKRIQAPSRTMPDDDGPDHHRNAPRPDPVCLYGLVGDVATAGSQTTEANPYAIALNFLAYISAAIGRRAYTSVGNTHHHCRLFTQQVGRTGRGRKGDAASLVHRIDKAVREADEIGQQYMAPQVHSGGLSTREGLALMIHDGWTQGKNVVEPIHDKRLWVIESEFANVLHQGKRDGNTLSSALRDVWDGVAIKPATKGQPRVWASYPHICLSAAITPSELRGLMESRELTNGFANRFLTIWAERIKMLPFPTATPQHVVRALAIRVIEVIRFAGGDKFAERDAMEITMSEAAQLLFADLYLGELNDQSGGESVTALLERRAPVLRRLAMLFALCDLRTEVDVQHVEAALAWVRYWSDSIKFIFSDGISETVTAETNAAAQKIVEFLADRAQATRSEITRDCFRGHQRKGVIDAALDELLTTSPPRIVVQTMPRAKGSPGTATKNYLLAANCAKSAKCEHPCGLAGGLGGCEVCEVCEVSESAGSTVRTVRTVREGDNQPQGRASADSSHSSHSSHAITKSEEVL